MISFIIGAPGNAVIRDYYSIVLWQFADIRQQVDVRMSKEGRVIKMTLKMDVGQLLANHRRHNFSQQIAANTVAGIVMF